MQETAVLTSVANYFQAQGYQVWCSTRGYESGQVQSWDFPTHQVAVAGRYPDLLAVNSAEHVVAVEAKGSDGDLTTGLGQALVYKLGAHASYLAAPADDLRGMASTALAHGLGLLEVEGGGLVTRRSPMIDLVPQYLGDVQRELGILSTRGDQTRRIGSTRMALNHPLHYLAPIFFIDELTPFHQVASALQASDGWGLGGGITRVPLEGARILGLIQEVGGTLSLTEKGRMVKGMVEASRLVGRIPMLRQLTDTGLLIDRSPLLGGALRFLYLEDPDIRQLREHLVSAAGELTLRQLLFRLLAVSPNVVLSTFCSNRGKEILRQYLIHGAIEAALEPDAWPRWLMKRSYYQLKRQLIHLGILVAHPARSGGRRADDLDADIWELRF